jgi:hypothetical protein
VKWLHKNSTGPVPEVLDSAVTVDSSIGAPYISVRRLLGKATYNVCYDEPSNRNHVTANRVPPETEKKRCNILRSLAKCMAQLGVVEFTKIGMVDYSDALSSGASPSATVSYCWNELTADDWDSSDHV